MSRVEKNNVSVIVFYMHNGVDENFLEELQDDLSGLSKKDFTKKKIACVFPIYNARGVSFLENVQAEA